MNKLSDTQWRELRISSKQVEKITNEVIEVMKKYNLSLNQAVVIFDSVKEELNNVPLWQETTQELPVQEQYEGKCEHCGYENKFKLSTETHLPDGVYPKFCMKCNKETQYSKMVNQKYLQEDAK